MTPTAVDVLAGWLHEASCMEFDGFCPEGLDQGTAERMLAQAKADPDKAAVVAALLGDDTAGMLRARHNEAHNGDIVSLGRFEFCPICAPVLAALRGQP